MKHKQYKVVCNILFHFHESREKELFENLDSFYIIGFFNWKTALQKFQEHQESEYHKIGVDYEVIFPKIQKDLVFESPLVPRMANDLNSFKS